jgi:hypothetical protein
VTPFESYFATKIEPALKGAPAESVKLAKQSAADIWNAAQGLTAIEAAAMRKAIMDYYGANLPEHLKTFLYERLAVIHNARVTP